MGFSIALIIIVLIVLYSLARTAGESDRTMEQIREQAFKLLPLLWVYPETESAARRIADLEREVKQREQNREHSSLKERLEENKRIIAERERENAHRSSHDRGMSR